MGASFCELRRDVRRVFELSLSGALLALLAVAAPAGAQGQTTKDLLIALEGRSAALEAIGSLERIAARIFYVESVALLSHYGGWPGEGDAMWQGEGAGSDQVPKFFYDVNNLHNRLVPELITLRRSASRSEVFTKEELERFLILTDELEGLIEDSQEYYELLKAGEIGAATEFFREDIRLRYNDITSASYTLNSDVSRAIDRLSLLARSAE